MIVASIEDKMASREDKPSIFAARVMRRTILRTSMPIVGFLSMIASWSVIVRVADIPPYILPPPGTVAMTLLSDWRILGPSLWVTIQTTSAALCLAVLVGSGVAVMLAQSRLVEALLSPAIVTLQVTPIVAIAPLILIYAPDPWIAQLICAVLVTFVPIVLNTLHGLKGADRDHQDLLKTYSASRWQALLYLQLPSALPNFFAGLRIAGGMALVAAVVGEFAAGQAGNNAGLAFRLLEAQYRLNTPRLFAALVLLAVLGAVLFALTTLLSRVALRHWHDVWHR